MSQFIALVKTAYVPLVSSDEEVLPGNIGALQFGLQAMLAEDARSLAEAAQFWEQAKMELATERSDDIGAGALGSIEIADDYAVGNLGDNF